MGHVLPRDSGSPAVLIHAVSLGEINATAALVKGLQAARPELHVIISTTTETGYDRGRQLYGSAAHVTLVRFPLDFTAAIQRLLNAIRPTLVVLMELELWPNFLRQCEKKKIPVALVNGRMTVPAYRRYRLVKPVTAGMLRRLAAICVQDEIYAARFRQLGAQADRVQITGTMKFDNAQITDRVAEADQLARDLGLSSGSGNNPLLVCGSTGPGEEVIILEAYRMLLQQHPTLRLAIIPRKPERFDEVATVIEASGFPMIRRSTGNLPPPNTRPVILGDTMGELRKFYSLATVVFVGRTLVDLGPRQHGSDMIEPAALAKPVAIGPWSHNFAEPMQKLKAAHAIAEVSDAASLAAVLGDWLSHPAAAAELGQRAQNVVRENQGATARHIEMILNHLPASG